MNELEKINETIFESIKHVDDETILLTSIKLSQ